MKKKFGWIAAGIMIVLIVATGVFATKVKDAMIYVDATFLNGALKLEGSTINAYQTTINADDPTADRTITTPDYNGGLPIVVSQSSTQYSAYNDTQTTIPISSVTPAAGWFTTGMTADFEMVGNIAGGTPSGVSIMLWIGDAYLMTLAPRTDWETGDYTARFVLHASGSATQDIVGQLFVSGTTTGPTIDFAQDTTDFSGVTNVHVEMDASSGNTITCEWSVLKFYFQADE